jgi:DNA-binding transcriptional ArsR family regulator
MAETGADVILHPVRMRIVSTLFGRQLTTQQIGMALPEVAQATLYRHLSRLVQAGVIAVIAQRPVRGVLEKVYTLAKDSVQLDPLGMGREDWERGFAAFTASLLGQFTAYLRQPGSDPVADGVSFRAGALHLSDAELTQFRADLQAVLVPLLSQSPSPERRRRLLSLVLVPDVTLEDTVIQKEELE